jgi:putative ABC transport system substrate-binding protein
MKSKRSSLPPAVVLRTFWRIIFRRLVIWDLGSTLLLATIVIASVALAAEANAQKVYSVGSLNTADQFINSFEGFKSRMAELGYVEGKNVRYQYYNSRGNDELLRTVAQKLVQDRVDLIVTSSTTATVAAAKATEEIRIPVLFLSAGNPQKLVKSFSSSGSHLAGISSATLELTGKRLELLKELSPQVRKIALPSVPEGINYQSNVAETKEAASRLGITVWEVTFHNLIQYEKAVVAITRKTADAIFSPPDSLVTEGIDYLVKQANKEKLPLMTSLLVNVKRGALATYAADYTALGRQGAVLGDKILKGTKPADLPIELPKKYRLVINMKTAKAIDLKIPRGLLLRADEIIE